MIPNGEPVLCRCDIIEATHEYPLHTIMWTAESFAHPNSPKAQRLIAIGAAQAAKYYLEGNDLGLLVVSGMTREEFEIRMTEMCGTLDIEGQWAHWKDKKPKYE